MIQITSVEYSDQIEEVRKLFREYESWLGLDLCFQGFEEELRTLPGKYAPPEGRIFLAVANGHVAGCIALRKLDDGICEMKRLFVRDNFRGQKIGKVLVERLISKAREIGYRKMRLDTYPSKMGKAVDLYRSHGFHEIEPYYSNPHEGVLFMEADL